MAASCLVLLLESGSGDEGVASRTIPLRGRKFRIGRSQECNLVVASERVSRHHARLSRTSGGRYVLEDLGSVHGTFVNGRKISGPVELAHGDLISIAEDEAQMRFDVQTESPRRGPRPRIALFFVGLMLIGGVAYWTLFPREPHALLRAETRVAQALEAREKGDWQGVQRELRSAAGILFQAGLLEGLDDDRPVVAALARLDPTGERRLEALLVESRRALESHREPATRPTVQRCRLDQAPASALTSCLRREVDFVLTTLGERTTTVPDPWLPHVGRQLAERREFFASILAQRNEVVPLLTAELDAAGISPLFHYLAFIESAYRPRAESHAGAAGIWQFIPKTARRYALEVSAQIDQRHDPVLATRAAAAYLRDLREHFADFEGSLLLAIAGYNYGEHKVDRALKKLDNPFGASPYWELVDRGLLPRETADYAPRFLAAAVAGESGLPDRDVLRAAGY